MRKTESMKTPAKKRLRSRFSAKAGNPLPHQDPGEIGLILLTAPTDTEAVDASTTEPQPAASGPEKPAAARSRKTTTAKKTNTTRQTKGKGGVAESAPLNETTPATLQDHAGGDGSGTGSGPAADPTKKKAPQPPKQGTRASARLKGRNPSVVQDPAPIKPENKRARRKREVDNEDKVVELPKKRTKRPKDQAGTSAQADTTSSDDQSADLVPNENIPADRPEEPADAVTDEAVVKEEVVDEVVLEEVVDEGVPEEVVDDEGVAEGATGGGVADEGVDDEGVAEGTTDEGVADEGVDDEGEGATDEGEADEGVDNNNPESEGELRPFPRPRFYLREDNYLGLVISLGYPPS